MANDSATAKKQQIAEHSLLNAAGETADDFDDGAVASRYVDKASGLTVDWDYTKASEDAKRMLALFGWRTVATNEASKVRQRDDGATDTPQDQVDAIKTRTDLIESGVWLDRTREAGPKYDIATLATAAVNMLVGSGRLAAGDDDAKNATYAKFFEAMTQDAAKITTVRQVKGVEDEYKRLKGKKTATMDDLAALAGLGA